MADFLVCDYRLLGRSGGHKEFLATGLGDGRGRYHLTSAGRLRRILPQDPKAHEPYPLTGVVRLRPKGHRTNTAFLLTFISGVVQTAQAIPASSHKSHAIDLQALGREERALRRVVEKSTQKMFKQLKKVDPEIVALAMLAFDDRRNAITWFARPHSFLGLQSPIELITRGRRRRVLQELYALLYGFPT